MITVVYDSVAHYVNADQAANPQEASSRPSYWPEWLGDECNGEDQIVCSAHIMIMADDQQVVQYLRLRLLAHDYEVPSPQAAAESTLVRAQQMVPDVLLCDSELDAGMKTARLIRERLKTDGPASTSC